MIGKYLDLLQLVSIPAPCPLFHLAKLFCRFLIKCWKENIDESLVTMYFSKSFSYVALSQHFDENVWANSPPPIIWALWVVLATSDMLTHTGTPGQASSPPPALMDSHQANEKMETVLFQLRHVTRERDELRKRLALSSPGTTFDDCRCFDLVHLCVCSPTQTLTEVQRPCMYLHSVNRGLLPCSAFKSNQKSKRAMGLRDTKLFETMLNSVKHRVSIQL